MAGGLPRRPKLTLALRRCSVEAGCGDGEVVALLPVQVPCVKTH